MLGNLGEPPTDANAKVLYSYKYRYTNIYMNWNACVYVCVWVLFAAAKRNQEIIIKKNKQN